MNFREIVAAAFSFLLPFLLFAQDEAAPLIEKLKYVKGIEKVDLLNEISGVYRKSDRFLALDYARQAYDLSNKTNYFSGKALAKKNEGICWFFIGNNDSASISYDHSLEIYSQIKDKKGISACYNNLGLIAQETGKYDEALKLYQQSIDIDISLGDFNGVISTKRNLVDIYIYEGKSEKALELLDDIIIECRDQFDKEGVMRSLINRAAIFDNLKKYNLAILDQKEAIALARDLNDVYAEAMAMSNLGLVTWHNGDTDEALKILNNVLDIVAEAKEGYEVLNTLWIMSEIYTSKREFDKSNELLFELLRRYDAMDNKRQVAKVLTSLGRNLLELNEIDKAMGYLNKSLEITVELNAPFEKLENYRNLTYAYTLLHDFKAADSLQDLFAETSAFLYDSAFISNIKADSKTITRKTILSDSTSDYLTALIFFAILILISVLAYRK